MSDAEHTDRRVARTQRALVRAMFELVREKGFEALSVSEITERADVGRSTFYTHYADKEDLLQGAMEGLKQGLRAELAARAGEADAGHGHPALGFCLPMLRHAASHRDLFAAMSGRGGALVRDHAHDIWCALVREAWPEADELAVQAVVGAFGSVMSWWLDSGAALAPEDVAARFTALLEPALAEPAAR